MIELNEHFRFLHWRPMPHSFGLPVASDWRDYPQDHPVVGTFKNCGLWTKDEAHLLFACARQRSGRWVDIGAHTMWTTAHIGVATDCEVDAVDPMLRYKEFQVRAAQNVYKLVEEQKRMRKPTVHAHTSDEFFLPAYQALNQTPIRGVCIDGDHHDGIPQRDTINAARVLEPDGVILLHDFTGKPVQDAALWLIEQGWNVCVYLTVHCVALAWRGGNFQPPTYDADPRIAVQNLPSRWPAFQWRKMLR